MATTEREAGEAPARPPAKAPGRGFALLWFVGLWTLSASACAALAYALRLLMRALG